MMRQSAKRASFLDDLIELLSSMRFAISLLTLLAIASIIGTVIEQNLPPNAYLNQFGQFWEQVFSRLSLYTVYNAGWFVAILAFLVLSTTLCVIRQFTPMLRDIRSFREQAREASLRGFSHRASLAPALPPEEQCAAASAYLKRAGFRFRVNEREGGTLIAAKQGGLGRVGYFLAHGAIVLICLGGLLDGNLPLSMQISLSGKKPVSGNMSIGDIPPSGRLAAGNWSFRGNIYIPEGQAANNAILNVDDGVLLQPLPFRVELKRFNIEYYETGMPKRYASDVVVTDNETGEAFERTLEVNKPFEHRGITLYQAGYDDGGSVLRFTAHGMTSAAHPPFPISGEVGAQIPLGKTGHSIEITGFRPFNVEDVSPPPGSGTNSQPETAMLGSGARAANGKNLRNLGPLYTYRLRDPAGQAREYNNYMQPVQISGHWYQISGVRSTPAGEISWLRIPLDEDNSVNTWFAIHQSFFDPARQAELVKRFTSSTADKDEKASLKTIADHLLGLFAQGGMAPINKFIETSVPKDKHEEAGEAFIQVLQRLIWDAWMMARESAGKAAMEPDETNAPFVRDAFFALTASQRYGAPLYLKLDSFEQRQATILQATRSPGKPLVYLGSLLLTLGVFAMLYIRERRLFVLLKQGEALVAMSSGRKSVGLEEIFARHREGLAAVLGAPHTT
ncbi:MAG: cytochrome c biogenesis protein ResB [Azoarcus sp.]|jgi:cytochrome c biogenesis protein|nr:cytochrome c biogenesis protein ResB [Azoarcus sp.]